MCIISKKFRALVYNKRYFDHGNLSDYGNDTDDNNIVILVISIHASPLGTFCGQFTLWQEVNQHSFCNHEPAQGLLWYFPFVSLLECCLFILGCVQVWVLFHRGSVLQWQTWSTFKGLQQVSTFSLACHGFKWIQPGWFGVTNLTKFVKNCHFWQSDFAFTSLTKIRQNRQIR